MNMIVNSSDLVGYEAENTKTETTSRAKALKKIVKAWESKQGRSAKKLGGLSLLAVSLAACNSEDTTPFSQSDVDAAVKTATDAVDITSDNAAILAQGIALGKASVPDAVDITSDNAAVLAQGIALGKASVVNDPTTNDAAVTAAALTDANGVVHASVDDAIASVDITSDNAAVVANAANSTLQAEAARLGVTGYEVMTNSQIFAAIRDSDNAQAVTDAVSAASGGAFNSVTTLFSSYNTLNNPTTVDFAAGATIANTNGNAADNNFTTTVVDAAGTGTTLNPGDVFNGAGGTDTLSVAFSGNSGGALNIVGVDTSSVETLMVSNFDANAAAVQLDATLMDGLTTIGTTASSANGDTTINNIGALVAAEMKSGTGDLTLAYVATAVAGTADTQTITLANQTAGAFAVAGIETMDVVSTVAANTITLTSAALTTVNVSGSANVNLGTVDFANATLATSIDGTINAVNATGNVSFTAAADVYDVRGGSGNDTFTFAGNLGANDVIDGNDGSDTVSMTAVAAVTGSTYSLTDIETFQLTTGADNVSTTLNAAGMTGISTIRIDENIDTDNSGNENYTVNNLAAGQEVTFAQTVAGVDAGGTLTVGLADASGTADSVTVNILGGAGDTAANNDLAVLSVLNVEELTITSGSDSTTALGAADDNTISTITTDATLGTLNLSGSDPLNVTVGASATGMTTISATGMTDTVSITPSNTAAGLTITGGSANDTFIMAAGLNNGDNINGGAGTDEVTATITSATATTGALTISNVESMELGNTGTAVLNVAGITGGTSTAPTSIEINSLAGTATSTTISGIDAVTQKIGLGNNDLSGNAAAGTFALSLADATGTSDNLTVDINEVATATITTSGVETLTVAASTTDTAITNATLTVSGTNVASIFVTGANADVGHTLGLGTLDTETTILDASGYRGIMTAAAAAATATTFTSHGTAAASLTGSSSNDTFTIGSTATASHTVNGNGGTDTLNITFSGGASVTNNISDTDTINMTVADSGVVTFNAAGTDLDGINAATSVNVLGGNSLSSVQFGGGTDALVTGTINTVIDANGFNGRIIGTFAADGGDNDVAGVTTQVIGGALTTDTLNYANDADSNAALQINTQGVEVITIEQGDSAVQTVVDLSLATGITGVTTNDASNESIRFNSVADGITFTVNSTDQSAGGSAIQVVKASSTGTADSQSFIAGAETGGDEVAITMADVETTNIAGSATAGFNNAVALDLSGISMTAASATNTVNFTGAQALTIQSTNADLATINASGMTTGGSVIMEAAGRSNSSAVNYTGSAGADTFVYQHANDVMDGGTGLDTLDINYTAVLGGINIDLSATDQITSINGGANSAVVSAFENVDLAGFNNFGAYVNGSTAANVITGTTSADQLLGGAGNDSINGGAGADQITLGTGTDTLVLDQFATADTITDYTIADDVVNLDVSLIAAEDGNGALTGAGAISLQAQNNAAATAILTTTDILALTDTNATSAAMENELDDLDFTGGHGFADNDELLVLWYDGTNAHLSVVNLMITTNAIDDTGNTVTDIAVFNGVTAAALVGTEFVAI